MIFALVLLTGLSLGLLLWQTRLALSESFARASSAPAAPPPPPVTLLKPVNQIDGATDRCLESWLDQNYRGSTQILFGVPTAEGPAGQAVRRLLARHPHRDAACIVCPPQSQGNPKIAQLRQLLARARGEWLVLSDADVLAPPDLLETLATELRPPAPGLVSCLYRLTKPRSAAGRLEAIGVNADFWTRTVFARYLGLRQVALGAVMALSRAQLETVGGFDSVLDRLADDYALGALVAASGAPVTLATAVVDCIEAPAKGLDLWRRQVRWARTFRACQPVAFGFSPLGNTTLWPLLWLIGTAVASRPVPGVEPLHPTTLSVLGSPWTAGAALAIAVTIRLWTASRLQRHLDPSTASAAPAWYAPLRDLLDIALWLIAFAGSTVWWQGRRYRLQRGGRLTRISHPRNPG